MTWQLLLGIGIFAEVFGRLIQRVLLRDDRSDPVVYAIVQQFLAGVIVGVFAFINGFKIPNLSPIAINLLLMPALYGLSITFIFKALKQTEASVFTILFASRAIWLILGAIVLLHEVFSAKQFIGAFLIIASIVLVSWKKQKVQLQRGEMLAILAAVIFAGAIVNDAFIVQTFDVASYVTLTYIASSLFILTVHPKKIRAIIPLIQSKVTGKILLLSFVYGITSITYLLAYKLGNNAAQLGALFQVSSILTVFFAIFLLKERSSLAVKLVAGVLSFIGVLLVK